MYKYVSSLSNTIIKHTILLQEKSKYRKEEQLFVIDGWKETKMAIENNFEIETIFFSEQVDIDDLISELSENRKATLNQNKLLKVAENVFEKISYRGNTSKVVSIAQTKSSTYNMLDDIENPLFLVIDGVEKPGNLGAILRIADAANIHAIFCADLHTDIFNPNVIRSSVGCLFSQKIIIDSKDKILEYLRERNVHVFTTSLKASKDYLLCNYTKATAFVVGTEATGVDEFWEDNAEQNIIIPMRGQNDSLNVSNSVAIVVFEALRQRNI
jgi:TrmH family RNA methyltransferase